MPDSGAPLGEVEVDFHCPYCLAPISVLVDPSVPEQAYVEDCEVCCHPIALRYATDGREVTAFEAEPLE
jgi:hypothetical protein